jgi:uncharacterized membrane protein (UPF0127 family)
VAVDVPAIAAQPFLASLLHRPAASHRLENRRNGFRLAERLMIAFDSPSRRKGLLGRAGLEPGTALVIAPCNAIHTWFMRFAIDVAFIAHDGRIVKARTSLRPWRIAAAWGASSVIELPAGTLARFDTRAGDQLAVIDPQS